MGDLESERKRELKILIYTETLVLWFLRPQGYASFSFIPLLSFPFYDHNTLT